MSDIVERTPLEVMELALRDSAAEIERLREQIDALRLVATSHEPEAERLRAEIKQFAAVREEWMRDAAWEGMSDSAEWLRNLARNYADGVPGMTPQDHHAWNIADEIERLRSSHIDLEAIGKRMSAEIERLVAHNQALQNDAQPTLDAMSDGFRAEVKRLRAEIERLRAALRDLIERWPTERGYDSAIVRARCALEAKE